MKTQRQSARLALRFESSCLRLDAEEASLWWRLGFEDGSKTSVVPSRFCKSATLQIVLVALTHLIEMRHNSVSREHVHNLSTSSLHSMIAVSSILYLMTP